MKKARYSQPEMDDTVDIVHCIKDALTDSVDTVYESVMEIYTLCKKTVTDKDGKIKALFELKGEYERKIKNLEYELHTFKERNVNQKSDLLFKKTIIERDNLKKRLNESEQSNIKGEILLEKSKERNSALMEENLQLKSKIEESNKNTTWMNVRMIKEKESEMKLIRYKMNDEINALKKQLDEKEDEKISLIENLQLKDKDREALSVNLKKIEKDYKNLNTTINNLKNRTSSEQHIIQQKLQLAEKEALNLKKALDHATQRFQEDRNVLKELIRKKESVLKNLYDENQKLNHEIVETTDKLDSEKQLSSNYYLQLQNKETKLIQLEEKISCLEEGNEDLNQKVIRSAELLEIEKQSSSDNYMKLMENDLTISKLNQDVSNSRLEMMTISDSFTRNIAGKEDSIHKLQKEIENLKKDLETTSKKLQKKKDQLKEVEKKSSERRLRVKKLEKEVTRQREEFREVFERKRQKQYNKLTVKSLKVLMDGYNGLSERLSKKKPVLKEGFEKACVMDNKGDSVTGKVIEELCLDDNEPNKEEVTTIDDENVDAEGLGKASVDDKEDSDSVKDKLIEELYLDDDEPIISPENDETKIIDKEDIDSVEETINAVMSEHLYSQILDEILVGISKDVMENGQQTRFIVTEVLSDVLDQVIDTSVTNKVFDQGVVKIVKDSLLKFYDEDRSNFNPKIKINSRVQFIGLCKHFSRKFQTDLRATYIAFNGSDYGIELTKDNEMNIRDQINCTFE